MPVFTHGWGRRTGIAACVLALVLGAAAGPAAAGPPTKGRAGTSVDGPERPARVTLGPDGRDLRLAGDLTEGVAARAAALLAAHPEVERIHLTSDGGLVAEGAAIGALVAARGLSTYVPDVCVSACTLIFVRGRARFLAAGGRLGFHAPYTVGAHGRIRRVDPAPERAAYRSAGLPRAFVARALSVPPAGIWIPDGAVLRAAGIVTEIVGPERFPDSTLDADPSADGARAAILRALPILRQAGSADLDPIARWYRDGYAAGRPEAEAAAGVKRMAGAYLRRRFRAGDDAVVRAVGRQLLAMMRASAPRDAAACRILAAGDLVALDARLRAQQPSAPGLARLLARTRPVPPSLSAAAEPLQARSTACAAGIAGAARALDLPAPDSAAVLRSLFLGDPQPVLAAGAAP
ncbi:hypothetical protein MMSR116_00390 [Methylobacterium mesophilicum SR1.6/6]|uniref:Uncharacterized protein n=1 Tax=Methylobacterium mesophilicum SR1.6/6 TaxID=908290 RepID=A0A6B9FDX0_9HYPH|nr:hypothetical protein [Methylobacterium mesophilicum]QGY00546.1 hypothetical protein MMSR116_00390 [Methylobacterium mesophilicum SR1.6/6]